MIFDFDFFLSRALVPVQFISLLMYVFLGVIFEHLTIIAARGRAGGVGYSF